MVLASYLGWVWSAPREIGRGEWKVKLPSGPSTLLQIGIGILDLGCCALAMYMLLPNEPNIGFVTLAVVFVSATLLGFASHAPGGLGVFDAAMLVALWQFDKEERAGRTAAVPAALLSGAVRRCADYFGRARNMAQYAGRACAKPRCTAVTSGDRADPQRDRAPRKPTPIDHGERRQQRKLAARRRLAEPPARGLACAARQAGRGRQYRAARCRYTDRTAAHPQALLIESLIGGLPGPAIVLDRDGRVIAFNAAASAIAPSLRRGEPALITLRMPELVDAIRRATASRDAAAGGILRARAARPLVRGLRDAGEAGDRRRRRAPTFC